MARASELRKTLDLKLNDAVMLAGVYDDLDADPPKTGALFANRNAKDFDEPVTRKQLQSRQCQIVTSFSTAAAKIEASLRAAGTPP